MPGPRAGAVLRWSQSGVPPARPRPLRTSPSSVEPRVEGSRSSRGALLAALALAALVSCRYEARRRRAPARPTHGAPSVARKETAPAAPGEREAARSAPGADRKLPGPARAAAAPAAPAKPDSKPKALVIADFEKGLDGFDGAIERDGAVAKSGGASGRIENRGKRWVTASKDLPGIERDFAELRLWARSTDVGNLVVRLVDATGQAHQQRPEFARDGEWQRVVVRRFDAGRYHESWGGAKDGKWHPPARKIAFTLEGEGAVWIDGVEALVDPRPVVPLFDLAPSRLGNVFLTDEDVTIPVRTKGDLVAWRATDFRGKVVAKGEVKVADGAAVVRPPKREGYFLLRMEARTGGRAVAEGYTSYCVIPPHEVKDRARSPFGVMTHFAQGMDVDILELFVKAGITSIRDEHYWAQVERKRGVFEFPEKSGRYMAAAKEHGIDPLIAMTFANRLYDKGLTPYTPEGCDAYGRYGQAILKEYGDQVKWLEIWNEYNGTWCKGPAAEDRPRYYAQMLKHAHQRIKEIRPDVRVLGCATVLIPMPYLEGVFRHGGLEHMDGVVIHPYRGRPEGVEEEVAELQELIRKYNGGRDKPIWVTETGLMDKSEHDWEKGRKMYEAGRGNVARYLARQYVLLLTMNVEKIHWYLCRDHHEFVSMGLLRHADDAMGRYAVAPPYVAYATLIRRLDGAQFVRREAERKYSRARVYLFKRDDARAGRRGGEEVRACWATHPSKIVLETRRPVTVIDIVGDERTLRPERGEVTLALDENVVYVEGEVSEVTELVVGEPVVADAEEDYGKTQGRGGWFYGYFDGDGEGEGDGAAPAGPYTDDDFERMSHVETTWGYKWKGPAKYLNLARGSGHPEVTDGRAVWAVLRWRSPLAGRVRIAGHFRSGEKGDGTGGRILVDGREVHSSLQGGAAGPARSEFDVVVDVKEGSLVDFGVTPGRGTDLGYDATSFGVRITVVGGE